MAWKIFGQGWRAFKIAEHAHFGDALLSAVLDWRGWLWTAGSVVLSVFVTSYSDWTAAQVWVASLVCGACIAIIYVAIALFRARLGKGPSDEGEALGRPNWPIDELFSYIEPRIFEDDGAHWDPTGDKIRDALSIGYLKAWGRPVEHSGLGALLGERAALREIKPDYWHSAHFTYHFFDNTAGDAPHTYVDKDRGEVEYTDVQVNRVEATRIWPAGHASPAPQATPLPTWFELEGRFKELESAMQFTRIDVQTGANGEYWRIAGTAGADAEARFNAIAAMASARLLRDFPELVRQHETLATEADPSIRWYKALQHIGGRYEYFRSGEQVSDDGSSGGFIHLGTINRPAAASASLCLTLASRASRGAPK